MRPILFSLLVSSTAIVYAYEKPISDGCIQGNFHDLVIRNSCGDDLSIVKCLAEDVDLRRLDQIEQCFMAGGCDAIDSTISAVWFSYECNERQGSIENVMKGHLVKRATETTSASETSETSTSNTATTAATTATTTSATSASTTASDSSSSVASSTTTSVSASTTSSSASSSTTSSSASSSTSSSSTSATSSGNGTSTSSLACSTTSFYSTSVCSFGTGKSTGVTLGCVTTSAASSTCAPGVLCTTAASGADICMKKQNYLTTSGLVITILFSILTGAFFIGFAVIAWKDRSAARKLKADRIAYLDAGSKEAMEAFQPESVRQPDAYAEADLPLMNEHS